MSRALISVSDKSGLLEFARGLAGLNLEILSTGGTATFLAAGGLSVRSVSEVTGFPEMLDGRVKTLHPRIHGGILFDRSKPEHRVAIEEHGIAPIDLVVVNLYPFRETAAKDPPLAAAVEMIDIGGPSMVRAAAKNFEHVAVVVDPGDYPAVLTELRAGGVPRDMRRRLALKAFEHTRDYDAAIARWLALAGGTGAVEEPLPMSLSLDLRRTLEPRYGENPHQRAAVYTPADPGSGPPLGILGGMRQLQGKELSWNNLLDADAARKLVALFEEPAVVIVKHNNPCGVGRGADLAEAYRRALETDPVSAFGSIMAVNRPAQRAFAEAAAGLFVEVLLTPGLEAGPIEILAAKKSLRLLDCPPYQPLPQEIELRSIDGGLLAQTPDGFAEDPSAWTCPSRRQPTASERRALAFAWSVARYTKSNAIVITNENQTVGIGAGQMSRVDSCRLAVEKARLPVPGCAAASDAFFPFRDGLEVLADAGVTAIVHPGGSKRDDEVVAAADERGVSLVVTGRRHFRH